MPIPPSRQRPHIIIISRFAQRRIRPRSTSHIPFISSPLPRLKFAFQPESSLAFLKSLVRRTACSELMVGVFLLKLLEGLKQALELLFALRDFVLELGVDFVATLDLGLEVADGAVDVALGTLGLGFELFVLFKLVFELQYLLVCVAGTGSRDVILPGLCRVRSEHQLKCWSSSSSPDPPASTARP